MKYIVLNYAKSEKMYNSKTIIPRLLLNSVVGIFFVSDKSYQDL